MAKTDSLAINLLLSDKRERKTCTYFMGITPKNLQKFDKDWHFLGLNHSIEDFIAKKEPKNQEFAVIKNLGDGRNNNSNYRTLWDQSFEQTRTYSDWITSLEYICEESDEKDIRQNLKSFNEYFENATMLQKSRIASQALDQVGFVVGLNEEFSQMILSKKELNDNYNWPLIKVRTKTQIHPRHISGIYFPQELEKNIKSEEEITLQ